MKTVLLTIIGIVILGFTSSAFAQDLSMCTSDITACQNPPICENTMWDCPDNSEIFSIVIELEDMGDSSIDLDPALSSSHVFDFPFGWELILVFVSLASVIIAIILLSTHFILKKKNIRSRPYITIVSAAIMLYFGIHISSMLGPIVMFLRQESPWHYLDQIVALLAYPIIGFSLIGLGIIFLYKSQLIGRLVKK
ncbi:MAG: hypothetical protein GKS07_10170 [Nitrosopumilus sp.]|nr:MAG: hypothetical protein GKS07_10170 [Nitrosopumilus sp.]